MNCISLLDLKTRESGLKTKGEPIPEAYSNIRLWFAVHIIIFEMSKKTFYIMFQLSIFS